MYYYGNNGYYGGGYGGYNLVVILEDMQDIQVAMASELLYG